MKKFILLTSIFFTTAFFSQSLKAQTEAQRIEYCTRMIDGATFQSSYSIQFPAQNPGERPQEFKQAIGMQRANSYRFTTCNDDALPGEAYIRIFHNGREIATNLHPQTGVLLQSFDFDCSTTGTYVVFIRFRDGMAGSAVSILSHVKTL